MPGLVGAVPGDEALHERMISSLMHETYLTDRYSDGTFRCARVHHGTFNPGPQPVRKGNVFLFMDGKAYGSESDPGSCLDRYLKHGTGFIPELNGSFVIIIYDIDKKKLVIANDRYGLRPLYYSTGGGKLLFAPEVKAILQDRTQRWSVSDEGVADFIALGKLMGCRTMFRGIEALPPASILTYEDGKASIEQYWRFEYKDRCSISGEELADRLVKAFREAVEMRMQDEHRYGASLSGGLDSRAIVGAVPPGKRKGFRAFSFGTAGNRESDIARDVATAAGVSFGFVELTPDIFRRHAEEAVYLADGMDIFIQGYSNHVYEIERHNVDVVFNGLGLDATLGGTYTYEDLIGLKDDEEAYRAFRKRQFYFSPDEMALLLNPRFYERVKDLPERTLREAYFDGGETVPANRATRFLFRNRLLRLVIMRSVMQRFKVEDALPTVDSRLIDLILQVPPELRANHRLYRLFLKKLSPELAAMPYQKTMVRADAPLWAWKCGRLALRARNAARRRLRTRLGTDRQEYIDMDRLLSVELRDFVRQTLLSADTLSTKQYLNGDYVRKLVEENEKTAAHTRKIVYLASFELFLRSFRQYVEDGKT